MQLLRFAPLCLALTAAAQEGAPRPWTLDDTLELARVGGVALSPDGEWVYYTERHLDWENNDSVRSTWLMPARGGTARRLEALDEASSVRFTPDGQRFSFVFEAEGDDGEQVYTAALDGSDFVAVTNHPGGVNDFAWTQDGARVWFTADEPRSAAEQAAWDAGGDAIVVGEDGNGLQASRWSDLWSFELASGEHVQHTDLRVTIEDFDVAPDGERVVFSAASDNRTNYFWRSELILYDRRNGFTLELTDNEAPEERPRWSPDGRWISYHAPKTDWYDLMHGHLWLMNPLTGDSHPLEAQHTGELGQYAWSPDSRTIWFSESRGAHVQMFALDVASDRARALTAVEGSLRVHAIAEDGARMIYTREDFTHPGDLWSADLELGQAVRLTDANPWVGVDVRVAESELVHWTASDGRELEGVLTLPPGWDGAEPLPLMMTIHGGPPGYFGDQFDAEFQHFAAQGYAVFGPNPRGSSSYGDEHLRALMGDVGGGELDDILSGVDHLIARGVADPERLALRGWSWGGILGAWTIAHSDRFQAASLGAMVGDWAAEIGGGLMYDLRLHYIGGEPWEDGAEWDRRSAQSFVSQVNTPTLLLHGEEDDVSTVNQSQMWYTALRARDVPVRFVKFPRQGHGIGEPHLERIAHVEELSWMARHVLDTVFEAPSRGQAPAPDVAPSPSPDAPLDPSTDEDERFFADTLARAKLPSLSVAVIADGQVVYTGAWGWADASTERAIDSDMLYQLASVSKTVTATVVLQLVEAGQLELEQDVNEVLPFPVRHPAHADTPINLQQLLTHSAGLRDNWTVLEGTWVKDGDYPLSLSDSLRAYLTPGGELYSPAKNFQNWAPGTRTRYSNVGVALTALVAEVATGRPFEELARERVLAPLGIEGGFRLAEVQDLELAMPQSWSESAGFQPLGHHGYLDFPAGTLRTSAPGLARFLLAIANGGELDGTRILQADTVAQMLRVQDAELDDEQGLVWFREQHRGSTLWGHDGGDPGVSTKMAFRPSDGVGYVLLMNGEARGRGTERRLVERLMSIGARH